MTSAASPADRLVRFYETLTERSVADVRAHYHSEAFFKDPFNEVRGVAAIESIFRHMFRQVASPRFLVSECVAARDTAFLVWDFSFHAKGKPAVPWIIHGATHVRFDAAGKVTYHRDYWDAAEELYEKVPVVGAMMRLLKRAARA